MRAFVVSLLVCASQAVAGPLEEAQQALRAAEPKAALALMDNALQAQPNHAPWLFTRGVALSELGRLDEAMQVFTRLTQEHPQLAEPYNNLAVLMANRGLLHPAREALELALRVNPSHVDARANLGDIYLRLAIASWSEIPLAQRDGSLVRKLRLARDLIQAPTHPLNQ